MCYLAFQITTSFSSFAINDDFFGLSVRCYKKRKPSRKFPFNHISPRINSTIGSFFTSCSDSRKVNLLKLESCCPMSFAKVNTQFGAKFTFDFYFAWVEADLATCFIRAINFFIRCRFFSHFYVIWRSKVDGKTMVHLFSRWRRRYERRDCASSNQQKQIWFDRGLLVGWTVPFLFHLCACVQYFRLCCLTLSLAPFSLGRPRNYRWRFKFTNK